MVLVILLFSLLAQVLTNNNTNVTKPDFLPWVRDRISIPDLVTNLEARTVVYLPNDPIWCTYDPYRLDICGDFAFCIFTDHWPQSNYTDWLNTTFFVPTSRQVYPSYCACANASMAYFLYERPNVHFSFESYCHQENAILAVSILLLIFVCFILFWASLELMVWVLFFFNKEKTFSLLSTFPPKLAIFFCLSSIIGSLCANLVTGFTQGSALAAQLVLNDLVTIFITFAVSWWQIVFLDVLKSFKTKRAAILLKFAIPVSWFLMFLILAVEVAHFVFTGLSASQIVLLTSQDNTIGLNPDYLNDLLTNRKVAALLSFFSQIILAASGILTIIIATVISCKEEIELSDIILKKNVMNIFVTIWILLAAGVSLTQVLITSFQVSPWKNFTYEQVLAKTWLVWLQMLFATLCCCSLLYGLKTTFQEGGYFKQLTTSIKTSSRRSGSGNSTTARSGPDHQF